MNVTLVAINAKNIHKSSSVWCLKSHCDSLNTGINIDVFEANINVSINDIIKGIINSNPDVLAFSCYIWNIEYVVKLGKLMRKLLSNLNIILGGPEVSFEQDMTSYPFANYIIKGEGEQAFSELLIKLNNKMNNQNLNITTENISTEGTSVIFDKQAVASKITDNDKKLNTNIPFLTTVADAEHNFITGVSVVSDNQTVPLVSPDSEKELISNTSVLSVIGSKLNDDGFDLIASNTKCKIINGSNGDFNSFPSPYTDKYFESFAFNQIPTIADQLVYYESSRGCPYNCSYCLSSSISGVQFLDIEKVQCDLLRFINNGATCIKFVDRTFNADKPRAKKLLRFILQLDTQCKFHFEAAADLFDEEMLQIILQMPIARVQFEIGVQSINEKTLNAINRKTDTDIVLRNISKLVSLNNCHIHIDLIAGLPYDTINTVVDSINKCIQCKPHMLQLGFLKMLKGTLLREQANSFGAIYADFSPYEVYQTDTLSVKDMLVLKNIEQVIDRFYNSGAFASTVDYAITKVFETPYDFFYKYSEYCTGKLISRISLKTAYILLYEFLLCYADETQVKHHIKIDCLSTDKNGLLPDGITQQRNKPAELMYKQNEKNNSLNICIEYFELDNKHRLFIYDNKDPITNRYKSIFID